MRNVVQFGFEFEARRAGLGILDHVPDEDSDGVIEELYSDYVEPTAGSTTVIGAHVPFEDEESGWKTWHAIKHSPEFEKVLTGSINLHRCSDKGGWSCQDNRMVKEYVRESN